MICFPSLMVNVSGFFTIDVFAGLHGFDGDFGMPMIRRHNRDNVDIIPVQNFAVIFVDGYLATETFLVLDPFDSITASSGMIGVDIADGCTVAEFHGVGTDGSPAAACADAAENRSFVRALERERFRGFTRKPVRHAARSDSGDGSL